MTVSAHIDSLRAAKSDGTFAAMSVERIWHNYLEPIFKELGWDGLRPHGLSMPGPLLPIADSVLVGLTEGRPQPSRVRARISQFILIAPAQRIGIITNFDEWEIFFREETIAEYRAEEFVGDGGRETAVWHELVSLIGSEAVESKNNLRVADGLWRKRVDGKEVEEYVREFNQLRKLIGATLIANPSELPRSGRRGRPPTAWGVMGLKMRPETRERDEMLLNHIVQRLIDRFIIFRFAEDNNILVGGNAKPLSDLYYRTLLATSPSDLEQQNTIWRAIAGREVGLFAQFAATYNGGVFEPLEGDETDRINELPLRDDLVRRIVEGIVHRPVKKRLARLLGYIYEKYIGQRLYIIANAADCVEVGEMAGLGAAKVKDLKARAKKVKAPFAELANTPDKKKKAIYYTPEDVTRYITSMTVGKIIEELEDRLRTARALPQDERIPVLLAIYRDARATAVLDPACGSGAFLIEALGIFRSFYRRLGSALAEAMGIDVATMKDAEIRQRGRNSGSEELAVAVITLRSPGVFALNWNIYGVDLDSRAVEICSVSLMIQVIDELVRPATGEVVRFPSIMGENIKQGNSVLCDLPAEGWRELLTGRERKIEKLVALRNKVKETHDEGRKQKLHLEIASKSLELQQAIPRIIPETYSPFNWPIEFPEVFFGPMRGFAIVIGNPPYADIMDQFPREFPTVVDRTNAQRRAKFDRRFFAHRYCTADSGDLYTLMIENMIHLTSPNRGSGGMIVPMSITYSHAMASLRETLRNSNSNWRIASFDKIPSAIFSDARVRTSVILMDSVGELPNLSFSPMLRWRADERPVLFNNLQFHDGAKSVLKIGFPKLGSDLQSRVLAALIENGSTMGENIVGGGGAKGGLYSLYFNRTAYNWLAFSSTVPPITDRDGLPTTSDSIVHIRFDSEESQFAALAILNGLLMFWFWLLYEDGFHVSKEGIKSFPIGLAMFKSAARDRLVGIGVKLQKQMQRHIDYKWNAGKKIGRYNVRQCRSLTDAADEIVVDELGLGPEFLADVRNFCANTVRTELDLAASDEGLEEE